jgi:hypothetical protein
MSGLSGLYRLFSLGRVSANGRNLETANDGLPIVPLRDAIGRTWIRVASDTPVPVQELGSEWTSRSAVLLINTSTSIMSANATRIERFVFNPSATANVWINPFGGTAAANAIDCIYVPPLTGWSDKGTNALTAISDAASTVNAGER